MAILTVNCKFNAIHGSREKRSDEFHIEVSYEGPVVDGFISGSSYTAIKGHLDNVLQELEGTWLNEVIGRATKERLAEYLLYRLRSTNPVSVRIVQPTQSVEISATETDFTNFEFSLLLARAEGHMYRGNFMDSLRLLQDYPLENEYINKVFLNGSRKGRI